MKIQQTTLWAFRPARFYRLSLCFPPQTPTASCPPWVSSLSFLLSFSSSAELIRRFLLVSKKKPRATPVNFNFFARKGAGKKNKFPLRLGRWIRRSEQLLRAALKQLRSTFSCLIVHLKIITKRWASTGFRLQI